MHLTGVDPLEGYYGKDNLDLTGEIVSESLVDQNMKVGGVPKSDYSLIKYLSTSKQALEKVSQQLYDVLVIDGDHSFEGVKYDFENYLAVLNSGGFVIFDDYNSVEWPDVKKFVDEEVKCREGIHFVGASWRTRNIQSGKKNNYVQ